MCPHRDSDRHKTEKGRSTKVEDRACMRSPSTHARFDVAVDVFISSGGGGNGSKGVALLVFIARFIGQLSEAGLHE